MGRDNLGVENILAFDPGHHRHSVFLAAVLDFQGRFSDVNVERHVKFLRQGRASLEDFGRAGIGGMGTYRRDNQGMVFPAPDELATGGQAVLVGTRVRGGKFHDGLGQDAAHPGLGSSLGDVMFKIVHVRKTGGAAFNHFGTGQFGAQPDEFGADKLTLDRNHIAHEPDIEA